MIFDVGRVAYIAKTEDRLRQKRNNKYEEKLDNLPSELVSLTKVNS